MFMKGLKRKKSVDTNVNFLTCPGVPALGPGFDKKKKDVTIADAHVDERFFVDEDLSDANEGKNEKAKYEDAIRQSPKEEKSLKQILHPEEGRKTREKKNENVLNTEDASRPIPRKSLGTGSVLRTRIIRWSFFILIVVVLAFVSPAVVALVRTGMAGAAAKTSVNDLANRFSDHDLEGAQEALDSATLQVKTAKESLRGAGYWRDLPGVGTQIRALEDASDSGIQALSAAQSILDVANAVLGASESGEAAIEGSMIPVSPDRSFRDLTPDEKRAMLARLDRALPDLKEAEAKIDIAVEAWNRIPQDKLIAPIRSAFAPIAEKLPRLKQTIDEALPLLEVFVPLAGYPKSATYLVLLQNTDEIRPTGGFIGTVGRLTIDAGDVKEFSFKDVYAIDNPASGVWKDVSPAPINRYLAAPTWYFRDSNWSPDFPTSANRLLDVYSREIEASTGSKPAMPDGIIAVNPPLFTHLMQMVGPVTVDGVTFDSNNYFDLLEYQVEQAWLEKGLPVDQRKDILAKLGDEVFRRLTTLPAARWSDLVDLLTETLNRKQMMIYVTRPDVLSRLDSFGWTNRVKGTNDDYLMVIDANLAALKTDGVMERSVRYQLDAKDQNQVIATVTLHYTNHAKRLADGKPDNFKHTRYRSYTRVYVPEGSELISSSGSMKDDRYRTGGRVVEGQVDVTKELGKTVFGAFWSIEPGTSQDLSFTYKLPLSVVDNLRKGSYLLDWQKQSGNDEAGLTLDLSFGKKLKNASPPEDSSEWNDTSYRVETNSLLDRQFSVVF